MPNGVMQLGFSLQASLPPEAFRLNLKLKTNVCVGSMDMQGTLCMEAHVSR